MSTMENPKQSLESIVGSTADTRRMLRAQIEVAERFIAKTKSYLDSLDEDRTETQAMGGIPAEPIEDLSHFDDPLAAVKHILAQCRHSLSKNELVDRMWNSGVRGGHKSSEESVQRGSLKTVITQNIGHDNLLRMPGGTDDNPNVGLIEWKDDIEKYMRRS